MTGLRRGRDIIGGMLMFARDTGPGAGFLLSSRDVLDWKWYDPTVGKRTVLDEQASSRTLAGVVDPAAPARQAALRSANGIACEAYGNE